MNISKNTKIMIMKFMAQIVSTWHMFDVLSVYGPVGIAVVAAISLGIGEYMISQEYAIMGDTNKLKKLMLFSLIGLSVISVLANIESFARHVDWSKISGYQVTYMWFAGGVYSTMMPAVIVTSSFIRLKEPVVNVQKEKDSGSTASAEIAPLVKVEEKKPELIRVKSEVVSRTKKEVSNPLAKMALEGLAV